MSRKEERKKGRREKTKRSHRERQEDECDVNHRMTTACESREQEGREYGLERGNGGNRETGRES